MDVKKKVLVIGGGTMGQGIGLACALAGYRTTISDLPAMLPRIRAGVDRFLADRVKKGKMAEAEVREIAESIRVEEGLAAASSADWMVEAIVESLEPKRKLFAELEALKKPGAYLCSNTSSLSVTAMAAGLRAPQDVLGLHFFNPATVMPLVEIVRTVWSSDATMEAASSFVKSLGKVPVLVKDTPGFVVNRVARSFPLEALKIVTEGIATPEQVDRVMKLDAGFKMGPFELMDLVGIDVNFAVSQSVFRGFFEEPRFRPMIMQQQLVSAGLLGRKTGRGIYAYDAKGTPAPKAPVAPVPRSSAGEVREVVMVAGARPHDDVAVVTGWGARTWDRAEVDRAGVPERGAKLVLLFSDEAAEVQKDRLGALGHGADPGTIVGVYAPRLSVSEIASAYPHPEQVVGFDFLERRLNAGNLVQVAPGLRTTAAAVDAVASLFEARGLAVERVGDQAGLVLRRILFMLVNEAAYALFEGVASREDIDAGMKLGTGYPSGPLAWADEIGLERVYDGLRGLHEEYGDDRYRACPLLRKMVAAGLTGKRAGAGFYQYR